MSPIDEEGGELSYEKIRLRVERTADTDRAGHGGVLREEVGLTFGTITWSYRDPTGAWQEATYSSTTNR